jgi:hypothetical protein
MQRLLILLVACASLTSTGAFAPAQPHRFAHRTATAAAAAASSSSSSSSSTAAAPAPATATATAMAGASECSASTPAFFSRRAALPTLAAAVLAGGATAASAKGEAGTKDDAKYQACLGKCVYYCTKPKGAEQKSRAECLPVCKKECATTSAQLFTPGKGDDVPEAAE